MAFDHDDHEDGVSRRCALKRMIWTSTGVLWMVSGGSKSFGQISLAQAATAAGQAKPTIPIIVKDKTSLYWRTALAGARSLRGSHAMAEALLAVRSPLDRGG